MKYLISLNYSNKIKPPVFIWLNNFVDKIYINSKYKLSRIRNENYLVFWKFHLEYIDKYFKHNSGITNVFVEVDNQFATLIHVVHAVLT